jgi:uncharacterized membrane protein
MNDQLCNARRKSGSSLAILCLAAARFATAAERVDPLPGDVWSDPSRGSSDLSTIVGVSGRDGSPNRAFVWVSGVGIQPLLLPGDNASYVQFLSADGATAAGDSINFETDTGGAFVWTRTEGFQSFGQGTGFAGANPNGASILLSLTGPSPRTLIWNKDDGAREIIPPVGSSGLRSSDISDDGSTVVGELSFADDRYSGFVWTAAAGLRVLEPIPGFTSSTARGISADGSTVVGYVRGVNGIRGVVWRPNDVVEEIPAVPGSDQTFANDASTNGATVVGFSRFRDGRDVAFVYTEEGGTQLLLPPGASTSGLWYLSLDGSTAVGVSNGGVQSGVFRWNIDTGFQTISVPGILNSIPQDVVLDSSRQVIVGIAFDNSVGASRGFVWSSDLGTRELTLPGYEKSAAYAVSEDGQTIVGWAGGGAIERGVVWNMSGEATELEPLPGDIHTYGFLISADGSKASGGSCDADWTCRMAVWTLRAQNEAPTPTGNDVTVEPVVTLPAGGASLPVQLTFDSVASAGTTTVTASSDPSGGAPASPPQFSVGNPPVYYDVGTTASFAGPILLCFSWQEGQFDNEGGIALFHFESGAWHNVTTSLDTNANKVCGQVTSLSPFALFESSLSFAFSGFFQPVDNRPTRNITKAGSAVPIKFALGGNQGLGILAAGYPVSQAISCDTGAPSDTLEETSTAGASGLTYDAASGRYTYVWKTQKTWSGTCKRFVLKLIDGSEHTADFGFTK